MTAKWSRSQTDTVARLFRTFRTVRSALAEYIATGLRDPTRPKRVGIDKETLAMSKAKRRAAVEPVRAALSPYNYERGREALDAWTKSARVADQFRAEVEAVVGLLIAAYENPKSFFEEVVPTLDSTDFADLEREADEDLSPLGAILSKWGLGAVLNSQVRAALVSASPSGQNRAIDVADERRIPRKGRPPARAFAMRVADKKFRGDVAQIAAEQGVKVDSVIKHFKRIAKKRPRR